MLAFLYCLILKIKLDTVVIYVYFDPKWDVKFKFASMFIQLVTITNLFPFKAEMKLTRCLVNNDSLVDFPV